jgi:hypothetical protein
MILLGSLFFIFWVIGSYVTFNSHKELMRMLGAKNKPKRWIPLSLLSWIGYIIVRVEKFSIFNY